MILLKAIKQFILESIYQILTLITIKSNYRYLIKIKLAIGISLLANNKMSAQSGTVKNYFENNKDEVDSLKLDFDLIERTSCYLVDARYRPKIVKPHFKGRQSSLNEFVRKNIVYPKPAIENKIEGEISFEVTISENGNIADALILNTLGYNLDKEAIRLLELLPPFKAGKIDGKEVSMKTIIIFHFELPSK